MWNNRPLAHLFYCCVVVLTTGCSGCWTTWAENYHYDEKNPFDTYALYELLRARPEGSVLMKDSLARLMEQQTEPGNYVFVGTYAYYNQRSVTQLLDFVERGSTAFIAAHDLPEDLAVHLFGADCYYSFYDNEERVLFENQDTVRMVLLADSNRVYEMYNVYDHAPMSKQVRYLNYGMLCDSLLNNEVLGTAGDYNVNFVRLPWGDGMFYLHLNPVFFTNYYLVDDPQQRYAEAVLAVLSDGPVYWDEASRLPPAVARQRNNQQGGRNYDGGRNLLSGNEALSYVQQQAPLALAWYTLIAALLLYVLFRGKRRQRIIPILVRRENSSQRFIDTMSRLVRQRGRHVKLAGQEVASLRIHLQERYNVRWREGEPPPKNLAELTGLDPTIVSTALAAIAQLRKRVELSEEQLLQFFRAIEPLYRR